MGIHKIGNFGQPSKETKKQLLILIRPTVEKRIIEERKREEQTWQRLKKRNLDWQEFQRKSEE
jgi:hypothetical protein